MAEGTLYLVATPIGNLEDITLRALRLLGEVAVVAAEDTRAAQVLLERHKVRARELTSCFEGNEAQRAEQLIARLRAGDDVALISEAGTPGVSDPGARLVEKAVAAGVRVVPVPGPSAAIAALIASGLPTEEFHFIGFPPRERGPRRERFARLRGSPATVILYESPNRTGETLADLRDALGGERRAVVARELTKIHEELRRGTLAELAAHYAGQAPRGEVTILVEGGAEEATIDLEAEVRRRVESGEGAKEIAAALSLATGKPRRQIYQLALSVKKL